MHPWADVLLPEPEHDAVAMAPAGQLWSTLADLGRFAVFLLDGADDVLPRAVVEEMGAPAGVDATDAGWAAYGLGLQVLRDGSHVLVGHGGSMPGFLAGVFVDRAAGIGTVALANGTAGLDRRLAVDLLGILRDTEPAVGAAWTAAADVDEDALALVGPWYWGPYGYALRLRADGLLDLLGLSGGGRASRFRPQDDGTWLGLDGYHAGETLRVIRDRTGVVALDVGSFVFSRTPYDPAAPHAGGVDDGGWRAGPA